MSRLKRLSGADAIAIFKKFGFQVIPMRTQNLAPLL